MIRPHLGGVGTLMLADAYAEQLEREATMSDLAGSVLSIHRYPVKSMLGEDLDACEIDERGLCGDRAYALLDTSDGKVASAKNPQRTRGNGLPSSTATPRSRRPRALEQPSQPCG
jgi:uncharacterized protein YcbX